MAVRQPKGLPLCRTASVTNVSFPLLPGINPTKVWLLPSSIERWRDPISDLLKEAGWPLFVLVPHRLRVGRGEEWVFSGREAEPFRTNKLKSQVAKAELEEQWHSSSHRNLMGRVAHKV